MEKTLAEIRRLMLATTKIDGAYYLFSRRLGIKENVLVLLYALDDGKPHSQKQICEDWLVPKTTINTNVKELVRAGYVMLYPGAGTREKIIGLTDAGKAYTEQIMRRVYEAEQAAMKRTLQQFSPQFVDAIDFFADCLHDEFQQRLTE
ncbi:MAG TPA: MarR family transcriptional regulator [Candidatus Faecousia gallistercoris]|nr:MarR family transcriptional regulator [Candidatus Faecousia gallistercoris]